MAEQQLQPTELDTIRSLRTEDELTFEQIGDRLGCDTSTAHRIVTHEGYHLSPLTLIRIRKRLATLAAAATNGNGKARRRAR